MHLEVKTKITITYFFAILVQINIIFYVVYTVFKCFMIFFLFILAGVIVLLSLAFLMPAFYYIPKASLAAVIICAVAPMVDYRVVAKMWSIRSECHLAILISQVTFIYVRYLN